MVEAFLTAWKKIWKKTVGACKIAWKATAKGCVIAWRTTARGCVELWNGKLKKPVLAALNLPVGMLILLVMLSAALLVYAFALPDANQVLAYVGYGVSAFTLTAVCIRVPYMVRRCREALYQNRYSGRVLSDNILRAELSLYGSWSINVLYAFFKFGAGLYLDSVWLGALAVYYMILSAMRFMLIRHHHRNKKNENEQEQRLFGLKSYRFCGVLMFLLNMAVVVLVVQLVWKNETYAYPGVLIYVFAAYSFYCIINAVRNMVRYHRLEQPVLAAAKMLSFACALMSILAAQTAMLTQFGIRQDNFSRLMNALTGAGVCLIIFGLAVWMVRRANRELKKKQ